MMRIGAASQRTILYQGGAKTPFAMQGKGSGSELASPVAAPCTGRKKAVMRCPQDGLFAYAPERSARQSERIRVVVQTSINASGKRPKPATARPLSDNSTRRSRPAEMGAESAGASKYISFTTRR